MNKLLMYIPVIMGFMNSVLGATSIPSKKPVLTPSKKPASTPSRKPATVRPALSKSPTVRATKPTVPPLKTASLKPSVSPIYDVSADLWDSQGGDINCTRVVANTLISATSFSLKTPTHNFSVGSSVSATPSIFGAIVIFPAFDGIIYAYNKLSKALVWSKHINRDYYANSLSGNATSRTTAAKYLNTFLMGVSNPAPADILKIEISTGNVISRVNLDPHPFATITVSGTVYGDNFYIGVSSVEEGKASNVSYKCCSFGGSLQSVHIPTMRVNWVWRSIPLNQLGVGKLSGAAFWGPSPSIDTAAGIVYSATGNNYEVPMELHQCYNKTIDSSEEELCNTKLYPDNYFNSVVAINITSGLAIWARRFSPHDVWTYACEISKTHINCPITKDETYDFGMSPTLSSYGSKDKAVYIAHKTGMTYCLNATTGTTIWATRSAPGGYRGSHKWGISVDESRVYMGVMNGEFRNWTLTNGSVAIGRGWTALDKVSGAVLWTTSNPATYDPSGTPFNRSSNGRSSLAWGNGPPAVVGDIVLVGSADAVFTPNYRVGPGRYGSGGYVYALSKHDGRILSSFETKGSVYGGFSADSRCAFVGYGYTATKVASPGRGVYGWCI